ncbi:MAG: phytanoyl-CoA dioxygenase family protein [Flavobacteriales bacterium]|nr:phytanoyl-CoA dioxygenase family protein [Flavobacteriales bacterium]
MDASAIHGTGISPADRADFERNGFLHRKGFFDRRQVDVLLTAIRELEDRWIRDEVKEVNGTPIKYGRDVDGRVIIQRFAFASLHHPVLAEMLRDPRFEPFLQLISGDARLGVDEKDGLVVNHYVNVDGSSFTRMGWHTDSLRDVFLGQRIRPMINLGIHLDDQDPANGGLRLLPGTHRQHLGGMLFRKRYFVDHRPDPGEVGFAIQAGDITLHDGRIWHRVEQSRLIGEASRRRVMYIPIISGKHQSRADGAFTPLYHRFQRLGQ